PPPPTRPRPGRPRPPVRRRHQRHLGDHPTEDVATPARPRIAIRQARIDGGGTRGHGTQSNSVGSHATSVGTRGRPLPRRYMVGPALGQAADSPALAVVEEAGRPRAAAYAVRHLVRFPPGTPYSAIAAAVGVVVRDGGLGRPAVVADLTAVG